MHMSTSIPPWTPRLVCARCLQCQSKAAQSKNVLDSTVSGSTPAIEAHDREVRAYSAETSCVIAAERAIEQLNYVPLLPPNTPKSEHHTQSFDLLLRAWSTVSCDCKQAHVADICHYHALTLPIAELLCSE